MRGCRHAPSYTFDRIVCSRPAISKSDASKDKEGDLLADQEDVNGAEIEVVEIGHG